MLFFLDSLQISQESVSLPFVHLSQKSQNYKTTHIMKHANMKNTLSFVCLKNINN